MLGFILRIFSIGLLCGYGTVAGAAERLEASSTMPAPVRAMLAARGLPRQSLSLFVQDVSAREPLLSVNADVPRNPASVMKIVTTLIALHQLNPAYRWETSAYAQGPIVNGRLRGDLIVEGSGDPFIVVERFWRFLQQLRQTGLREINGDLVIDDSKFDIGVPDPGAFDNKPYRAYNVAPNPLLINFGVTRFTLRPNRRAGRVTVVVDPPFTDLQVDNELRLTRGKCGGRHYRVRFDVLSATPVPRVRMRGKYPAACGRYSFERSFADSKAYAYGLFKSLWEGLDGTIAGSVRSGIVPVGARRLHTMRSRPLGDLIRLMNKFSNNVMTRHLLLTIGGEQFGFPATLEKGREAVRAWFSAHDIPLAGLAIDNGAGLSRESRLTARSLGALLLRAYASPYMPEFVASLPIAAVDGTLATRFNGQPLAGRMHVKTGLINDVRSMAGYVLTESGRTFVVVALQNHKGIHNGYGTDVQNAFFKWVFRH